MFGCVACLGWLGDWFADCDFRCCLAYRFWAGLHSGSLRLVVLVVSWSVSSLVVFVFLGVFVSHGVGII